MNVNACIYIDDGGGGGGGGGPVYGLYPKGGQSR